MTPLALGQLECQRIVTLSAKAQGAGHGAGKAAWRRGGEAASVRVTTRDQRARPAASASRLGEGVDAGGTGTPDGRGGPPRRGPGRTRVGGDAEEGPRNHPESLFCHSAVLLAQPPCSGRSAQRVTAQTRQVTRRPTGPIRPSPAASSHGRTAPAGWHRSGCPIRRRCARWRA